MSVNRDPDDVLRLLGDDYARAILRFTSDRPLSASALSERCGASDSTIYRRIEQLRALDLLHEYTTPDPDGGHYTLFEANLARLSVRFEDGELDADVDERDPAEQFAHTWDHLRTFDDP